MAAKKEKVEKVEAVVTQEPVVEKQKGFLDDASRTDIVTKLSDWGIPTEGLSDTELVMALSKYASKMNDTVVNKGSNDLKAQVGGYLNGSSITDEEFGLRLLMLSVPSDYLPLFTNRDTDLTDGEIWEVCRHSGINIIPDFHEICKDRFKKVKNNQGKRRDIGRR